MITERYQANDPHSRVLDHLRKSLEGYPVCAQPHLLILYRKQGKQAHRNIYKGIE